MTRSPLKIIFFTLTTAMFITTVYIIICSSAPELKAERGIKKLHEKSPPIEILEIDETNFTEQVILDRIHETNQNVYVAHLEDAGPQFNSTCGHYASPLDIKFNNLYWQEQNTANETYFLYGAYYDNRPLAEGSAIRILGMVNKLDPPDDVYCLMWFEDERPAITKIFHKIYIWYNEWGNNELLLQPFLWSCRIPTEYGNRVPDSVSFVGQPCERPTNNLRVVYNPVPAGKKRKDFVVCVKSLEFKHNANIAIRLVEWIELLKILGADKIVFNEYYVHDNITKVLEYYKKTGYVEVIKTTIPGNYANIPDFMSIFLRIRMSVQAFQEVIQYTDCLYRNLYQYQYVVLHDVDEVIVPLGDTKTWQQLLFETALPKAIARKNVTYAAVVARNIHFIDDKDEVNDWYVDIPKYMHMLQNVLRNSQYVPPSYGIKAFHNTDVVLALHNHYPRACLLIDDYYECECFDFDLKDAHLQHYCLGRNKPECMTPRSGNLTLDTSLWKYKSKLISSASKVLRQTGFLKNVLRN